jgi:hypothetical protein
MVLRRGFRDSRYPVGVPYFGIGRGNVLDYNIIGCVWLEPLASSKVTYIQNMLYK